MLIGFGIITTVAISVSIGVIMSALGIATNISIFYFRVFSLQGAWEKLHDKYRLKGPAIYDCNGANECCQHFVCLGHGIASSGSYIPPTKKETKIKGGNNNNVYNEGYGSMKTDIEEGSGNTVRNG